MARTAPMQTPPPPPLLARTAPLEPASVPPSYLPPAPPPRKSAPSIEPPPKSVPPIALAAVAPPLPPPILVDVTPRALVVEVAGGFCDTIIPRNAKIPCERTRGFSPSRDHQTSVIIRVAQGESEAFHMNTYLGELELSELRAEIRSEVTIAVTFAVDASGTVAVRATDTKTGREARASLQLVAVAAEDAVAQMRERAARMQIAGR
jgi:molecular chaperone DnaK (HSP70)